MKNSFADEKVEGVALICNLEGEVKKVLHNSLGLPGLQEGILLPAYVEENSFKKAVEFIKQLREKALFGWELNVKIKDDIYPLNFSGIKAEEKLLILAGNSFSNILNYYEQMVEMNNKHINRFRKLVKNKLDSFQFEKENSVEENDYEKLSKLNNELANLQRELVQKNKKLENEREKFRITLESIADGVIVTDKRGDIKYLNPVAERLLNVKEDNIIDKNFKKALDIYDCITNSSLNSEIADELNAGKVVKNNEAYLKVYNRKLPISYKASPIINKNEKISGSVIVIRDIVEQKRKEEKLRENASTDELTGIYNRRKGIEYLEEKIKDSDKNNLKLSICFTDVNNLKEVNDNYGHKTGDNLLKDVARVFKNNIREDDLVARFGGDEFLLIFPGINKDVVEKIWNRILDEFKNINKTGENLYEISVSHGIAEYNNNTDLTANELINIADKKMYEEKREIEEGEIRDG